MHVTNAMTPCENIYESCVYVLYDVRVHNVLILKFALIKTKDERCLVREGGGEQTALITMLKL